MDGSQHNQIAKALSDPRRFEILELIAANEELSCSEVVEKFHVAQPTISHHLRELSLAGLIEARREGQFNYYRFQPTTLETYFLECRRRLKL